MFKTAFISVALIALPILGWAQLTGETFPVLGKKYTYTLTLGGSVVPQSISWTAINGTVVTSANNKSAEITWTTEGAKKISVFVSYYMASSTYELPVYVSQYSSAFSYTYDANGARISRTPIEVSSLKSSLMTAEEIAELEALLRGQDGAQSGVFGKDSLSGPAVRIYPNPTQAVFSFDFSELAGSEGICASLALTTMQGASIPPASCGEGTAVYDLSSYPAGSYLLQLSSGAQAGSWLVTKH